MKDKKLSTTKKFHTGTRKLLSALAIPKVKKQGITPQQKANLLRLQQLRKMSSVSNYNQKQILENYYKQRLIKKQEAIRKNSELSSNTKLLLENLQRIQTKADRDAEKMSRVVRERRLIQHATDLLKTPNVFAEKRGLLDFTGVHSDNILKAENSFKEQPESFILRKRARNILDTKENTLRF